MLLLFRPREAGAAPPPVVDFGITDHGADDPKPLRRVHVGVLRPKMRRRR